MADGIYSAFKGLILAYAVKNNLQLIICSKNFM